MLRRKLLTSNAYIRKEGSQVNGLSFNFKKLEKSKLKPKEVEENDKDKINQWIGNRKIHTEREKRQNQTKKPRNVFLK